MEKYDKNTTGNREVFPHRLPGFREWPGGNKEKGFQFPLENTSRKKKEKKTKGAETIN